jgi:hypothetical protein
MTCVLYFEAIEKGMVVVSKLGGKTNFARFTWKFKPPAAASGKSLVN